MSPVSRMTLCFTDSDVPQLEKTVFYHPLLAQPLQAFRGKTAGAHGAHHSFQWSPAVRALCLLLLTSTASSRRTPEEEEGKSVMLQGEGGSAASSLDYALAKQPNWLLDMLGSDTRGHAIARRVIKRSNPERRRPGPCVLSLNSRVLSGRDIEVYLGERLLEKAEEIDFLYDRIAALFSGERKKRTKSIQNTLRELTHAEEVEGSAIIPRTRKDVNPSDIVAQASNAGMFGSNPDVVQGIYKYFRDQSLAGPHPRPFAANAWLDWLRFTFHDEIVRNLACTDIFCPRRYRQTLQGIYADRFFRKFAGAHAELVSNIDLSLSSIGRLGTITKELSLPKDVNEENPLRVTVSVDQVASISILNYLKFVKGCPLDINYCFSNAAVLIDYCLDQNDAGMMPHICMLSLASAGSMLNRCKKGEYRPLMLMPRTSRHVVASCRRKKKISSLSGGTYAFMKDTPSGGALYYDRLLRENRINPAKSASEHVEADEMALLLNEGEEDIRGILWFPYYNFNMALGNCLPIDGDTWKLGHQESVMFVHESIISDYDKARWLDVEIRNAWLELKEFPLARELVVHTLAEDRAYVKLLKRCGGLHNVAVQDLPDPHKISLHNPEVACEVQ